MISKFIQCISNKIHAHVTFPITKGWSSSGPLKLISPFLTHSKNSTKLSLFSIASHFPNTVARIKCSSPISWSPSKLAKWADVKWKLLTAKQSADDSHSIDFIFAISTIFVTLSATLVWESANKIWCTQMYCWPSHLCWKSASSFFFFDERNQLVQPLW